MKYAADIGCGPGSDSISLAKPGLNVTSVDSSTGMIQKAKANSLKEKVKIKFSISSAANIPENFNESFDLVTSFGNTFSNIEKEKLEASLKRCCELLKKRSAFYSDTELL